MSIDVMQSSQLMKSYLSSTRNNLMYQCIALRYFTARYKLEYSEVSFEKDQALIYTHPKLILDQHTLVNSQAKVMEIFCLTYAVKAALAFSYLHTPLW